MLTTDLSVDVAGRDALPDTLNEGEGWHLLTIYWLSARGDARVRTGKLAAELGISPSSVTEMMTKLSAAELVTYEKYDGVETTTRGASIAGSLAWRQCVVVAFFDRLLEYEVDDRTAYRIGFALPLEAIVRLENQVDNPREDACRRIRYASKSCLVEICAE